MTDKKGKLIASNVDVNNNGLKQKRVFTVADIPICLLEIILSYLTTLKDNLCASAVCKTWRAAAEFVRVVEKHPWVISLPDRGDLVNLFDPLEQKMFTLNLPEIVGATVCYAKDGWLLMRKSSLVDLFFFNPYTRQVINMPKCTLSFHEIAFSSAPTSITCTVIALEIFTRYVIGVTILYPGATEWISRDFVCSIGFHTYEHSNLVYVNDHFYCFSSDGILLDVDVASKTFAYVIWKHSCPYIHSLKWSFQPKRMYLTEQKGELILMYTCGSAAPMMYRLVSSKYWEEVDTSTLNGLAIFASRYSTEARVDILGMRNSMYFPKYGLRDKCCVSYSFDEGRYYPRKQLPKITKRRRVQINELCPLLSLWIEPPSKDVLDLM